MKKKLDTPQTSTSTAHEYAAAHEHAAAQEQVRVAEQLQRLFGQRRFARPSIVKVLFLQAAANRMRQMLFPTPTERLMADLHKKLPELKQSEVVTRLAKAASIAEILAQP